MAEMKLRSELVARYISARQGRLIANELKELVVELNHPVNQN
jgi:hypothetical protein